MNRCLYTWEEYGYIEGRCPEEIWSGSEEYCIFHDPSLDKDVELFEKKLKDKLGKKDYFFREYCFPETADLTSTRFEGNADFEKATFQDADFSEVIFQGNANFNKTTFQGNANFNKTTFQKEAYFRGATFQKYAGFFGIAFQQKAYFTGAVFRSAYFRGATFRGNANFSKTTFQGNANFIDAIFQGNANFEKATFQEDADFRGITLENISFSEAIFQCANFSKTTFPKEARFGETIFQKDVHFRDTTFQEDADFGGAVFQDANFIDAIFQGNANFNKTTFQKEAYFRGATFQYANFIDAIFQGNANFNKTTFQKEADFRGAAFQDVDFERATIEDTLEFAPKQIEELDLKNARFYFRANIATNLAKAKFHRAYLENVVFIDCSWPEKIYEEVHMKDEGLTFKELETIYRNLKQNMQRYGDYSRAGDFYFRETEMRRKGTETKRNRLWLELYRFLAGYGEKPFWVIRNSLLVIFLGAVLFFFSGVARVGAEIPQEVHPYIIDHSLDSLNFSITTFKDFGYCLYYSVVTFTTLGYGDIHPLGHSHIFASVEALTGAFFMALFVVVFARKMMR